MPPRRSARVAAVLERESCALAPLPEALALAVFALLPADERVRCALVGRGWRAVLLSSPSLWRHLDLSDAAGLRRPASDAALLGAAALARGTLVSLDLTNCPRVHEAALLRVLADNASLATLRVCDAQNEGLELVDAACSGVGAGRARLGG
jgi:hypothetical protein